MAQEIVFFDLPSAEPRRCWSLNLWKARLILNYKGIPYTTTWLEYPEIEPNFKALGVEPHEAGSEVAAYTLPIVHLPDGRYIMESQNIALELENLYPEPMLPMDQDLAQTLQGLMIETVMPVAGVFMNGSKKMVPPLSAEYIGRKLAKRFGKSTEQLEGETSGDEAWKGASSGLKKYGDLLREDQSGPYLRGKTVSYGDFVIAGVLQWAKRIDEGIYQKIVAIEPSLGALYTACRPWLHRDDH